MKTQTAFRIHALDNVATALDEIAPGAVLVHGEGGIPDILALQAVPQGHKLALLDIPAGALIVKYGVPIGEATAYIPRGTWVHLHCLKSRYDERSSHLDYHTGAPLDTRYL
jgi:altronate dehydratase